MRACSTWLVVLCLTACQPPPHHPPDAAVANPTLTVEPPTTFVRDAARSEAAAAELIRVGREGICGALLRKDRAALARWLHADFSGAALRAAEQPVEVGRGLTRTVHPAASKALKSAAFLDRWWTLVADLAAVERCTFKPFRFLLDAADANSAWAKVKVEVGGRRIDSRRVARRGTWTVRVQKGTDGEWRLTRARTGPLEVVEGSPAFVEVGEQVGIGLRWSASIGARIKAAVDRSARSGVGGLGAVDWDADGFEDVLVWVQGLGLTLFRNDGQGGFAAQANLVPARAVGHTMLLLDLDGDGREELLSSEVIDCRDGVARFGLWRRTAAGLVPVPGGLPFAVPCDRFDGADLRDGPEMHFQHLAPGDVDGDGDLDLFVAGYSDARSFGASFNFLEATDGLANLLFLNEGGLRFREVAVEQGLTARQYSYVAEWLDLDADGDLDLFVGNDYGSDAVYRNDDGHLTRVNDHPLATSGWSMGLAVADFDGDGRLDLSLSRMYSTAGNRIVPLAADRLTGSTLDGLRTTAAGNALFSRDADGRWRDRAKAWGVNRAGWAWGQAAADFDNDGDTDLYVANGMTSHSTRKDADY